MAVIQGTPSSESLDGTREADRIDGGGGNDRLRALAGHDTLWGGAGADTLFGGIGDDTYRMDDLLDVIMEAFDQGNDWILSTLSAYRLPANVENGSIASGGRADLAGNALANLIVAGSGNNRLDGGAGIDTLSYQAATAGVDVSLGISTAQDTLGSGIDRIRGFENLTGSAFGDFLIGSDGANVVEGQAGNDTLRGGAGDDTLVGGAGADVVVGDVGTDVFIIRSAAESGPGVRARDTVAAFVGGSDFIDLSAIDADPLAPGDQSFTFIGSEGFDRADATGQLRYHYDAETDTSVVFGSTDADAAPEFSIALHLVGWVLDMYFVL